jgi:hypothetical protein
MSEACQRCKENDNELRALWMACSYNMEELELPFEKIEMAEPLSKLPNFYTLSVCKRCRADWMDFIRMWFHIRLDKWDEKGSGIFIRHLGATIEVSEEKFRELYPNKEPVRVKRDYLE